MQSVSVGSMLKGLNFSTATKFERSKETWHLFK